ncbi:MAG: hypothetical protein M5R41_10440 [Bacteroidia bacterium]|nr:hypothetical protein [Bacteroidia bacterium]
MPKNIHVFSQRLLRFIESKYPSKVAFVEDVGISSQSLHTTYLKETPFPGSMFFHDLALLGCDLNWLMTGAGLPPDPSIEEMARWLGYCEGQVKTWTERLDLELAALDEIRANIRRQLAENPDLPSALRDDDA